MQTEKPMEKQGKGGGGRAAYQQNAAKNAKVKSENEFKLLLNSPYKYAHMHERASETESERERERGQHEREGRGGRWQGPRAKLTRALLCCFGTWQRC